jgi:hypothetical protein
MGANGVVVDGAFIVDPGDIIKRGLVYRGIGIGLRETMRCPDYASMLQILEPRERTLQIIAALQTEIRPCFYEYHPPHEKHLRSVLMCILRRFDANLITERKGARSLGKQISADFSLFGDSVAVESKLVTSKRRLGQIRSEILEDINGYTQVFPHVVFVVYDQCGAISDTNQFVREVKGRSDNIWPIVIKQ